MDKEIMAGPAKLCCVLPCRSIPCRMPCDGADCPVSEQGQEEVSREGKQPWIGKDSDHPAPGPGFIIYPPAIE